MTLRSSHVVPSFVFRWMRESSPGFMRDGMNADRRVQDGPKRPWLCDECEQRLSQWEKPFAEQLFAYVHRTSEDQKAVSYGAWAIKFAVSVSWRTLLYYQEQSDYRAPTHMNAENLAAAERAESRWRRFLLDEEEHPGPFEQHVLFVDTPAEVRGSVSPFISRYLTRSVHIDLLAASSTCVTYTKLCRVVVFGFVQMPSPGKWKGTKLHVKKGSIGGRGRAEIPEWVLNYWNEKADAMGTAFAGMSPKQKQRVSDMFRSTPLDALGASEAFRAMRADVALSGKRAFSATGRPVGMSGAVDLAIQDGEDGAEPEGRTP